MNFFLKIAVPIIFTMFFVEQPWPMWFSTAFWFGLIWMQRQCTMAPATPGLFKMSDSVDPLVQVKISKLL